MAVNDSVGLGGAKADAWERELARRSGLVAERHTVRGMYFNGTLDALRSLGQEPLVRRCVEESGESHFLDFFSYPARLHYRMVSTALPALAQEYGGAEEGLRQLGQQVARRVWGLGVGKVMLSLSPLSPRQLQSALPMAYRTSVSIGEYEVRWMGPCSGRLTLKQDFMPYPFHEGMVKTSLGLWGGARYVSVAGRQVGSTVNATSGGSERLLHGRGSKVSPPLEFSPGRESLWAPRLAQATSEDMARGLFFQGALRAIRVLGDEELAARCAAACGQAWFFDFFNYSIRLFLEMVSTALPPLMERHGEAECTLWLMGHCVATDFLESEAGRAMQVLVRGEARRLVNHLPSTYLVSVNGTRSVEWLGPQHCRFTMQRDFAPAAFHEGMLVAMLERMDARRVHVVGVQTGVLDSEYDISWR